MKPTKIFATLCAAGLVSGCAELGVIVAADYCVTASRVELRDLCDPGVSPALTSRGWGSCSITTRHDAETLAAEARKFDERCRNERSDP